MVEEKNTPISFKDTLNLPVTEFPIRVNHKELDAQLLQRWREQNLDHATCVCNSGSKKFIVHDGPPYANGPIHLGHAYNKILKDIIAKSHRMAGAQVPVTPGYDCHGLPIEIKVSQEQPTTDRLQFIKNCRAYAQHWIGVQTEQFKALGVLMDWEHPYTTMSPSYEAAVLRAFGTFVERGFAERNYKTIAWCASCKTSLAAAEIEYKNRKDPSLYVCFELDVALAQKIAPSLSHNKISLLVWTTTPWTLPLNRAVAVKPDAPYVVAQINDQYVILAHALVAQVSKMVGQDMTVVAQIPGSALVGASVHQPLTHNVVPVVPNPMILLSDGTACVHIAPGCGPEDYELARLHDLEIYSPLTADGHYTDDINPKDLAHMAIVDAQGAVIKKLKEEGSLLHGGTITHSYPHCWRCRNGLMFRATKQWFLSLEREQLQEAALAALEKISFIPEQSRNHLRAAIESRLEWCISRQKIWGVPIPALLCKKCDAAYITKDFVDRVAAQVAQQGIEYWVTADTHKLSHNTRCAQCGACDFEKEQDILDVWFDSGVSHYAVLKQNPELAFPADVYIEGRDQARGWFQSSLLTSMVLNGAACTRTIITHGYTVDERREKMSKSLGNVVAPQDITDQYGTDVLRLWVASIDYIDDAVVSESLLRNVQEVYRKIRNTLRFLLSNLAGFDMSRDQIAHDKFLAIDIYALRALVQCERDVRDAYERADFTRVVHRITDYVTNELSSLYLDIIKDRLYCDRATGINRRSAQTVCFYILDTLTRLLAPILSFTAEQISDFYQRNKTYSIHLQSFADIAAVSKHVVVDDDVWAQLLALRSAILKAIEIQREKGIIKHSLESRVLIFFDAQISDQLKKIASSDFLREFLIVSQVELVDDSPDLEQTALVGLKVLVQRARGTKCPRCWQYEEATHEHGLCSRCKQIVS